MAPVSVLSNTTKANKLENELFLRAFFDLHPTPERQKPTHTARTALHCRHLHHIASLWSLLPLDDFELYLVALLKALITFTTDRAVVYKDIWTILASDESKSLRIVKPFDGSLESGHLLYTSERRAIGILTDGLNRRKPREAHLSILPCRTA